MRNKIKWNQYQKAYKKQWDINNPSKMREYSLKHAYGLSVADFNNILVAQDYKCAICKTDLTKLRPNVDHCHASGQIRGILCTFCNTLLGNAKDSLEILQKAIEYLNHFKV